VAVFIAQKAECLLKYGNYFLRRNSMSLSNPTLEDVWRLFQETDRKFLQMREESDRNFEKLNQQLTEKIEKVSADLGRLGNKLGDFIEEMVRPAAVRLFKERGIDVHEVHRNISSKRDGEEIEIDLLVVNNTDAIAIECKSTLSIDDVNEHLERMEKLKRLLPDYRHKNIMGAVTAMIIPDNVARYAYKQGLFVIGQTGEQLVVRNDLKFKAKIW
jgi:hypothetical protein